MFYGTSGVLTSVVTHYPNLDFAAICRGYADGWSADKIHALGQSLVPHAQMVAEQVTAQWVMEARRSTMATNMRWEDVVQPTESMEVKSEASVFLPPTKPNVVPTIIELPPCLSIAPLANLARGHNGIRLEIVSLYKR